MPDEPKQTPHDAEWQKRIDDAVKEGAPVFQKNGLPIVCQRGFDGALLEHEHADHPDYKYPVEVEYVGEKVDAFKQAHLDRDETPEHEGHDIDWDRESANGFCKTCGRALSVPEIYYLREYDLARINHGEYEPHDEALIYSDEAIALTLYECCYTLWHHQGRSSGGKFLHGPAWNKDWRLSDAACVKIWPGKEEEDAEG